MIFDKNIYTDKINKCLVTTPQNCECCNELITDAALITGMFSRSKKIGSTAIISCLSCREKALANKILYDHIETNNVKIVSSIKRNMEKYLISTPQYKNNKNDISIYEAADKTISTEKVIDHTNHSTEARLLKKEQREVLE